MEQIENALIDDLTEKYHAIVKHPKTFYPPERFEEKFDYSPPRFLNVWFEFCRNNRKAMAVLLDPQNGDTYFVKKLKGILKDYINTMMDDDGMPRDGLREYFVKIFMELHFLAARTWLTSEDDEFLSVHEIINLLNTMRVGANYLTYRRLTSEDFDMKMRNVKNPPRKENGHDLRYRYRYPEYPKYRKSGIGHHRSLCEKDIYGERACINHKPPPSPVQLRHKVFRQRSRF